MDLRAALHVPRSLALLSALLLACASPTPGDATTDPSTGGSGTCGDMCEGTGSSGQASASTSDAPGTGSGGEASSGGDASSGGGSSTTGDPLDNPSHRFLAIDNGLNHLLLVDQRGGQGWSVDIPGGSRDLQLVTGDHVLVSHGDGAAEYALSDGGRGWSVTGYSDIQSARRLPGGETLLAGGTTDVTFYTLDQLGMEIGKVHLPGYLELRLVRVLDNEHLLFTAAFPFRVVEVDMNGAEIWQAPLPDKGYTAERLPGGETLATAGEPCLLVTLDASGEIMRKLGGEENFPGVGLDWFSGFHQLPGGNVVVANWLGHDKWGTGPHLVELTPDNTIAWSWADHDAAMQITNVLVLE